MASIGQDGVELDAYVDAPPGVARDVLVDLGLSEPHAPEPPPAAYLAYLMLVWKEPRDHFDGQRGDTGLRGALGGQIIREHGDGALDLAQDPLRGQYHRDLEFRVPGRRSCRLVVDQIEAVRPVLVIGVPARLQHRVDDRSGLRVAG